MAHSYICSYFHCVFSTKERRKLITPELEVRLWPFLGGIARDHDMKALAIGGIEDHVHLLLSLPSTIAIAKAIQVIKGESSKWVHDTFPEPQKFAWQEGYGAFTIGISQKDVTVAYIQKQKEHRRKKTFHEEYLAFLKKHNVDYDPRFVWG